MNQALPKVDRAKLRAKVLALVEDVVEQVADAVDEAAAGRVIQDSEEKAKQVLDEFRREVYQLAVQAKVDAAEAAFPPSDQRGHGQTDASQGAAGL